MKKPKTINAVIIETLSNYWTDYDRDIVSRKTVKSIAASLAQRLRKEFDIRGKKLESIRT